MDCIFCKIGKKEVPSEVIYEDGEVLAFLDINPISLGHSVVIPKIHAQNVLDLDDGLVGPVFGVVKKVTGMLQKALNPQGFTIGINHGKVSGQAVDHLHVHVIPRFEGDGGSSLHSVVQNKPQESVSETKKRILN